MTRRVALVTGAGRRVGADVARHLARMGFQVIVHVRSSVEAGEKVVREILEAGGHARVVACELTDNSEVMRIFDSASADGGVVSVIVNNASYFQYDRPEAPDVNILKRSIDVHITAPVLVFECAIEKMNAAAGMTTVNILDQKVENINPDYYSYTIRQVRFVWHNPDVAGDRPRRKLRVRDTAGAHAQERQADRG